MLRGIRDNRVLLKNTLMIPEIEYRLAHSEKNFIDIELEDEVAPEEEEEPSELSSKDDLELIKDDLEM